MSEDKKHKIKELLTEVLIHVRDLENEGYKVYIDLGQHLIRRSPNDIVATVSVYKPLEVRL